MDIFARGKSVRFDDRYLLVELADERVIATPLAWYPELLQAAPEQRQHWQFICDDSGIEWIDLDYHLSIESMLIGSHAVQGHAVA